MNLFKLVLCVVVSLPLVASAGEFVPQGPHSGVNPSGMSVVEVLAKLPLPAETKAQLFLQIGKIMGHPAIKKLELN